MGSVSSRYRHVPATAVAAVSHSSAEKLRDTVARDMMMRLMTSQRDLRGSRRELAAVFADGPKTAHEASKELGKQTGSIFGVLKRMHSEGLLVADTDEPTRGTQYTLSQDGRELLRESMTREHVPGALVDGQQLLLVDRPDDVISVQRIFARASVSGAVAWTAEVASGWLLALDPESTSSYPLQRLELELAGRGITCTPLHVTGLLSGRELRSRASWLLEELEAPP